MSSSLSTLILLKSKYPGFYWGENESGYYWGDKSKFRDEEDWIELMEGFTTLEELLEDVDNYNLNENSNVKEKYEKFDNEFYAKLLDYLSEKEYLFLHWNREYDLLGEDSCAYHWWYEDTDLGGSGFNTLQEVVEDIFSKIKYLAADY